MKVSIQWLREYVDFSMPPEDLAHVLTMAGQEVEGIEHYEDDVVLDISVTPNRPDCLSVRGIAREISAILGKPFRDKIVLIRNEEGVRPLVEIEDPELCLRYSSRIVRGVKIGPSPEWITKRLERFGLRPVNNIVDITNYVLIEMGHPLHAFDMDKLEDQRIIVQRTGKRNEFQTLDGETRTIEGEMLLICDGKRPVAVAGVMGGLNSEVSQETIDVFLESAYFDPPSVRRTSRALSITTDASYRFERGADIKMTVPALDRAVKLILEIAGGKTSRLTDVYVKTFSPREIFLDLEKMNALLGTEIEHSRAGEILQGLGIQGREWKDSVEEAGTATHKEGKGIVVTPPSFRQDIQRDTDVIEEVARLYGYDNIPSTLPRVEMRPASENPVWKFIHVIKESMRKSGYSEAINYSFLLPSMLDTLGLSPDDRRRGMMTLRNPLKKDEAALRTTLIPALLENVQTNIHRGVQTVRLFEIAKVFFRTEGKLPDEVLQLGAVFIKGEGTSVWRTGHDGFYDMKGALEQLFSELGIKGYYFQYENNSVQPYLNPGKYGIVQIKGETIGHLGALHPRVAQSLDIGQETFILELDIERLLASVPSKRTYSPLPRYPCVERDLAVVISEDTTASAVEQVIWNMNDPMIESVTLFDIYRGKPVPDGQKSLAFSVRYRRGDRTLTTDEVNRLHARILESLKNSLKAELRS